MSNLLDILNKSVNYLEKKNIKNARIVAETAFSQSLRMERIMLYANFEKKLSDVEINEIKERLNEAVAGMEISDNVFFEKDSEKRNGEKENLKTLID
ncbi:MAG: peptide chain release factor N(5)-glutamine methyltransferase, partial [Leptotrichiaceae bacterium]|nr:peptide chain release factor N(5)-glutamine methyltransferase [Leptotrichiaceae bacterium]